MESRVLQLISALRAAGVRISLADSAEAFRAIEILGIAKREQLWLSLSTTLIKDRRDMPVFNRLFPLFLGSGQPPGVRRKMSDELTPEQMRSLAEALLQLPDGLRADLQRLTFGAPLKDGELEDLGRMARLGRAADLRYENWLTERLLGALGLPEVQRALGDLLDQLTKVGVEEAPAERIIKTMQENLQEIRRQVRQFVGRRLAGNMRELAAAVDQLVSE
jgi:uncharacterized protein